MSIKIDVQTNINEYELTIDKCSEIIGILQDSYQNIRKELYNHFLGTKTLKKAILFAIILLVFYYLTGEIFFAYLMPVSVILSMITSIVSAEYITSQTRKQIYKQLQHYIEKREHLLRDQKIKV